MKKITKIFSSLVLALSLLACGNEKTITVGVSPIPHQEIIEVIREDLKKEGYDLNVVVFNDYVQPNLSLKEKSLDANFFQHAPYMKSFGEQHKIDMVSAGSIHLEPLKIYSNKVNTIILDRIKSKLGVEKVNILIPNDPTNRGRALLLLQSAGYLKLKDSEKLDSGLEDIESMEKGLVITPLNSEQIAPRLDEVELAVINTNNALASKLTSDKAVFVEGKDSPYANIVTVLKENENSPKTKALIKVMQSEKIKSFIMEKYRNEVVPAF